MKFQKFRVPIKGLFMSTDRRMNRGDYNFPFPFLKSVGIKFRSIIGYNMFMKCL